jgi:hypothetical protein
MTLSLGATNRWRCLKRGCRAEIGLGKGTFFEEAGVKYVHLCTFIYGWAYELASLNWCLREADMSDKTVTDWSNFLREVCADDLGGLDNLQIGGPGLTVEIDESMFAKRKSHVGRMLPRQWVFGGICRETGEVFLEKVQDRSLNTLYGEICHHIKPGTTIISDCWKGYSTKVLQAAGYVPQK